MHKVTNPVSDVIHHITLLSQWQDQFLSDRINHIAQKLSNVISPVTLKLGDMMDHVTQLQSDRIDDVTLKLGDRMDPVFHSKVEWRDQSCHRDQWLYAEFPVTVYVKQSFFKTSNLSMNKFLFIKTFDILKKDKGTP